MKKIVIRHNVVRWQLILAAVVCAFIAFCALPNFSIIGSAKEKEPVTYIDKIWDKETNQVVEKEKTCTEYKSLSNKVIENAIPIVNGYIYENGLTTGWYVLDSNFVYKHKDSINISGDVHLILKDDCVLTQKTYYAIEHLRICVKPGSTLTIYGQEQGTGKIDKLEGCYTRSGIHVPKGATLNIKGGVIEAEGTKGGAGIGGDDGEASGTINILGGTVKAEGGNNAAGIGGGYKGAGGTITINGGTIVAEGRNGAANIGGGKEGYAGIINVTGGNIKGYSNHTITLEGVTEEVEVVGINCDYGINDVHTLDNGKLYFNISDEEYAKLTEIVVEDKEGNRSTYKKQGDTDIFYIKEMSEISPPTIAKPTIAEPMLNKLS